MIAYKYVIRDGRQYEPLVRYVPTRIAKIWGYPEIMPTYRLKETYYDKKRLTKRKRRFLRLNGYWLFKRPVGRSTISGIINRDIPSSRIICLLKCRVNQKDIRKHNKQGKHYEESLWVKRFTILEEIPLNRKFVEEHKKFFNKADRLPKNVKADHLL